MCQTVVEGDPRQFFVEERGEQEGLAEANRELPDAILNPRRGHGRVSREDIDELVAQGFNIDDDNEPVPENNDRRNNWKSVRDYNQEWVSSVTTCCRKHEGFPNHRPKMSGVEENILNAFDDDVSSLFLLMLPRRFFEEVVLPQTNANLLKASQRPVTFGELLRWIGIWFYMATCKGYSRDDFWSSRPIDEFVGAPTRFNKWMSKRRFDYILGALVFHATPPPLCQDRFHFVRELINAWNENMADKFIPSWASCLDESMSVWLAKCTCPGWMCVERKPHPFGNQCHSICCGLSGIMHAIELVEGNDEPPERPRPTYSEEGPTGGLLLRLTRPIHNTGKVVILDSGFSVLDAIVALKQRGVFATTILKKRRFWPKYCPGDDINLTMTSSEIKVGDVRALKGEHKGTPYHIICMKEEKWITKVFDACGTTVQQDDSKMVLRRLNDRSEVRFRYCDVHVNHYEYRHAVDDHNHLRQANLSLEDTWKTHRWENRVFAFILAMSEVNAFLAMRYFVWRKEEQSTTILSFRRMLARALIFNDFLLQEEEESNKENAAPLSARKRSRRHQHQQVHELVAAPLKASSFAGDRWLLTCKNKCQQHKCKTCQRFIRTCCSCSLGEWMCVHCHTKHVSYCVSLGL